MTALLKFNQTLFLNRRPTGPGCRYRNWLGAYLTQPAFKNITGRWIAPKNVIGKKVIEDFIRDALSYYFHPVGTCKMGVGSDAVVDSQLKVHGITGLRVADASVMPTITSANTNAATMMMEKLYHELLLLNYKLCVLFRALLKIHFGF